MSEENYHDEIIQLLVAAGYFRARIKGLSPFDKIVGGITWSLEMCNEDIDVDLLFKESLSIGQKISLTEKIVSVLQKMKCPVGLEPHQLSIQGMDYSNIFPVVQWLVKRSFEYRQMVAGYIKSYAIGQFNKCHSIPQDSQEVKVVDNIKKAICELDLVNKPERRFRHPAKSKIEGESAHIRTTLLEYGRLAGEQQIRSVAAEGSDTNQAASQADNDVMHDKMEQIATTSNEKSQTAGRVSVSVVGSIVGSAADEIAALAEEYNRKRKEIAESSVEGRERSLRKQLEEERKHVELARDDGLKLKEKRDNLKQEITLVKEAQEAVDVKAIEEASRDKEKRSQLLSLIDSNKKKKSDFRTLCRTKKNELEGELETLMKLDRGSESGSSAAESEDEYDLTNQLKDAQEKLSRLRAQLAKSSRTLSSVQRKMDDTPSRAELSQYQKRFVELYDQVSAKHVETKKFFLLYNQCQDARTQLEMELKLLNSIIDSYEIACSQLNSRESFYNQFESIVKKIDNAKLKVTSNLRTESSKRDSLNQQNSQIADKQRLYYKLLREFTEACKENSLLVDKLNSNSKTKNSSND
ncbi:Coiled-coil domain-containing protein 93 [Halotydeus destructor]|nr:Coiled-coil domain-containing protein 93 [Halotydeus destructor]